MTIIRLQSVPAALLDAVNTLFQLKEE